ncbi:hypothetical protein [Streptococcus sp. DD13]|uniref:hypothetical protein n=1 Tax=Streptococcus sp. DD13 TaxID=1777881 RepID=UPI00079AEF57|nr:hypothetical protein [Streptococcus sp. DD13]KXT78145.1 hypothetical protein STRDD13_00970 [Streptococcus sp. DD13]
MKKQSIFKASFEESLNLEDDGFRKLQQEQHDKTVKFFKNGHASLWFRIRSFILSLIFPVGFNFILLAISMQLHESDTLTLPIAEHESLTANVFLILLIIWLSLVVIGKFIKRTYLLPYRYQFHAFTFMIWFLLEMDLIFLDFLLANLASWEIIGIVAFIVMIICWMFTVELEGLRKLMYGEVLKETFRNKIAKMIALYGMGILGLAIIVKHLLGFFAIDVSNSIKGFGFLLLWIFCNFVLFAIVIFIGFPYFLHAYYKWKYPEDYREWEGQSVEEWYGKAYLKKHPELSGKETGED